MNSCKSKLSRGMCYGTQHAPVKAPAKALIRQPARLLHQGGCILAPNRGALNASAVNKLHFDSACIMWNCGGRDYRIIYNVRMKSL